MADDVKNVLVALGSPSDKKLIEAEECKAFFESTKGSDIKYWLGIGSSHRTSELVDKHYNSKKWSVIMPCAGLTNMLENDFIEKINNLKRFNPDAVIFSVPISDSATGGLSSLLSGSELPPGYVGGVVGIDKMLNGLRIAHDIANKEYKGVLLFSKHYPDEVVAKIEDNLKKFKVEYLTVGNEPMDIDISFAKQSDNVLIMAEADVCIDLEARLKDRLIIGMRPEPLDYTKTIGSVDYTSTEIANYIDNTINETNRTLFTGIANPTNFALMAAKIIARNNPEVADAIKSYLADGIKKYDEYKELILLN